MKIGVVADTHSGLLPQQMVKEFNRLDLIIHAGDFCTLKDFERLAEIKEIKAVHGNMDEVSLARRLPGKQILNLEGHAIGVFHGTGSPQQVLDSVRREFKSDAVECVVFGHSHMAFNERVGDVLYFNPGSPTDTITAPYRSYGILEVNSGKTIRSKIIKVK